MTESQGQVHKHVFLDYTEYQRLLEAQNHVEHLRKRIQELEKKVSELQQDQDGKGLADLTEKENKEKLQAPLVGIAESITLPPNTRIQEDDSPSLNKKWYFLGKLRYESK